MAERIPFTLKEDERRSKLWSRLVEHYEQRLSDYRAKNDAHMTDVETAHTRGRIAEIKAFLALNKDLVAREDGKR